MSVLWNLKGSMIIAKREFLSTLFSVRFAILLFMISFGVIGAAYGLAYIIINDLEIAGLEGMNTPDEVMTATAGFIHFFGSLAALTISFDSILNERLKNTLELLLYRPVGRKYIALGKFMGIFASLSLPLVVIVSLSSLIVGSMLDSYPALSGTVVFILFTLLYLAIFVLIQQIFSTLANTTGTAILSAMFVWMFFIAFWPLIPGIAAYFMGIDTSTFTPEYLAVIDKFGIGNPGILYQLCVMLGFGATRDVYISHWMPFVGMAVWFLVLLLLFVFTFEKRIAKG